MYKNKILFLLVFSFFLFTNSATVFAAPACSSPNTCETPKNGDCPGGRLVASGDCGSTNICCAPATSATATSSTTGGLRYTLLEKIPGFTSTDGSDLPKYITAIYNLALVVIVLSAVLMLSVGGFMYLTSAGNTSAMGTAKGVIFDSLIGLVIALIAWLLLSVINPDLVKVSINGLSAVAVPAPGAPGAPGAPTPPVPAVGQFSNADAVAKLNSAGITVTSSGNCSDQMNASCTSLEGIPKSTIDNIIKLKSECGCSFNVTGGTEVGHVSHGPGLSVVDVSEDAKLKTFLKNRTASYITKICATASNQDVTLNCTYKEPAAHFHLVF